VATIKKAKVARFLLANNEARLRAREGIEVDVSIMANDLVTSFRGKWGLDGTCYRLP